MGGVWKQENIHFEKHCLLNTWNKAAEGVIPWAVCTNLLFVEIIFLD